MRLAIYVPKRRAEAWQPAPVMGYAKFLAALARTAGGITVTQATGMWHGSQVGYIEEPVVIVEALLPTRTAYEAGRGTYAQTWQLLREYAAQLLADGEESVLIVQDHEPTFITA